MQIENGKSYLRGDGSQADIVGPTKAHPEYAYSRQGDWYEYATGRFVFTASGTWGGRKAGERFTQDGWRNIVSVAP